MAERLQAALEPDGAEKRIVGFDLAEALACLMVVVYHLSACSFMYVRDPRLGTAITTCFRSFLTACVPLFLMVNGYLRLRHNLDLKQHIFRLIRLLLLTVFWGIWPMLIQLHINGEQLGPIAFFRELMQFDFYGPVIHLWYMGALFVIYLFLPLLKLAYDNNRKVFVFFLAFTAIATTGCRLLNQLWTVLDFLGPRTLTAEAELKWFSIFTPYNGIRAYPFVYFCLGGLLPDICSWLDKRFPVPARRNALLLGVMIGAAAIHTLWFLFLSYISTIFPCPIWNGYNTVTGIVLSVCMLLLCLNYRAGHAGLQKLLRTISENSFGIYLMHMLLVLPLRVLLPAYCPLLCNEAGNILVSAAVLALCVLASLAIRRIPGIRWLLKP